MNGDLWLGLMIWVFAIACIRYGIEGVAGNAAKRDAACGRALLFFILCMGTVLYAMFRHDMFEVLR